MTGLGFTQDELRWLDQGLDDHIEECADDATMADDLACLRALQAKLHADAPAEYTHSELCQMQQILDENMPTDPDTAGADSWHSAMAIVELALGTDEDGDG